MPANIKTEFDNTVSAFTSHGELAMNFGNPIVAWTFPVKDLENWLTTLEEMMLKEQNVANRWTLERLYFSLKAAHKKHCDQHDEIVTDAPSEDDLIAYLTSYAASVSLSVD